MTVEFKPFDKIPRFNRPAVVTEKLDGTNACVVVVDPLENDPHGDGPEDLQVFAQSRNRLITPESDNFGFARWVKENGDTLRQLGPGYHYGEWWGKGIQRGYGLEEKRFSLFNVSRWHTERPSCCHVVPLIGRIDRLCDANYLVEQLKSNGSYAAPGFMDPEGVIVWSEGAQHYFKITCKNDESPKGQVK